MKSTLKLLFCLVLFVSTNANSQEQFKRTYNHIEIDYENKKDTAFFANTTFVFNYKNECDVKVYMPSGKEELFTRVGEIYKEKRNDGVAYQCIKTLDEDGSEVLIALYDDGYIKLLYSDSNGNLSFSLTFSNE